MLYRPAFVALAGLAVWLLLRIVAPIDAIAELRWNSLIFVGLGYGFFFIGCIWAEVSHRVDVPGLLARRNPWNMPLQQGFFWMSMAIGLGSMVLRVVDRVIIRGIDYSQQADELRESLETTEFSGASAIASVIMPFCFIPLILLLASRWEKGHLARYGLAVILFVLPMIESLAQSSRSIMLLTIMMGFFSICLLRFRGEVFHRKLVAPSAMLIVLTLLASSAIFSSRLSDYGRSLQDSLYSSVYAVPFQIAPEAQANLTSGNTIQRSYYETILPNSMYYLHGVYEFDTAFNRPDEQKFGYGLYIFYPYARVLALLLGTESSTVISENEVVYRTGVFTTFFGPIWVDFGYFSMIVLLGLGFIFQRIAPLVANGNVTILPFYLFGLVVIFFMPVFNFLVSGFGFFIFHGFALFALFASFGTPEDANEAVAGESAKLPFNPAKGSIR